MNYKLLNGNCLEQMKKLKDNTIDSIVTDPPAGISFMQKGWDSDKGGKDQWVEWLSEIFVEVKRVLKPGGHCIVWSLPRTSHWTGMALENAGFEVRDCIYHTFGTGFPKSFNVEKKCKELGYENIGIGIGSGLKPAVECYWLIRKPISEKTIVDNVIKWGTGGINIDKCRIGTEEIQVNNTEGDKYSGIKGNGKSRLIYSTQHIGRFPSNFIQDGSEEVMDLFPTNNSKGHWSKSKTTGFGKFGNGKSEYEGVGRKEEGGSASRFFYCPKCSTKERNMGMEEGKNNHCTIKPVKLMSYLINLITPTNGVILDPFMGSGSTGISALLNNYRFIGIELDPDYLKIAEQRIKSFELYREFLKDK